MMGKFVLTGMMLLLSVVLSRSTDTASLSPPKQESSTLDTNEIVTPSLPSVGKLESKDSDKVELSSAGPSSVQQIYVSSMDKLEPSSSFSPSLESATSVQTARAIMTSEATDGLLTSPAARPPLDILASVSSDQENSTVIDSSTILPSTLTSPAARPPLDILASVSSDQENSTVIDSSTILPSTLAYEPSPAPANSTLLSETKKDGPGLQTVDFNAATLSPTQAENGNETRGGSGSYDNDGGKFTPKPYDLTTPVKSDTGYMSKDKDTGKIILISVIIVILILLLVTMVFLMVRKKKRSGSFRTQSRKGARDDAWAGQVPELWDGKGPQDSTMVENGTAGTKSDPPQEQEMVTFVSGEKTMDSVEEANELEAGDKAEANGGGTPDKEAETTPLLAEDSQSPQQPDLEEEQLPPPM